MKYGRTYNFSAGPAMMPEEVLEEIAAEVFEAHADEIFEEAENRLHVQKAVMYLLMKD